MEAEEFRKISYKFSVFIDDIKHVRYSVKGMNVIVFSFGGSSCYYYIYLIPFEPMTYFPEYK